MSITDSDSAANSAPIPSTPPRLKPNASSTWVRVALACLVLVVSGGLRLWQTNKVEATIKNGRKPAFDLNEIPMTLGAWKGKTTELDPYIARGTGADIIVTRRYINDETGVSIDVIFLFGPAVNLFIHMPEVCYPAAGYKEVEAGKIRTINAGSENVPFRTLVYGKTEGVVNALQEVYYTWRYSDRWTPDVGNHKAFERVPGMYKLHLARRVEPGEHRDAGNPCEDLLKLLVPEIEQRLNRAEARTTTTAQLAAAPR